MARLGAEDLLALWERGWSLHPIGRALAVLAGAMPDREPDELARLPLGVRDGLLLAVRRDTLGDPIQARDDCAACGESVEVELTCSGVIGDAVAPPPDWWIEHGDHRVQVRPLDSTDAAAAAQCSTVVDARDLLLARTVVAAECRGEPIAVDELPGDITSAVSASVAARDAGAEIQLELTCPACGNAWTSVLDAANFVWAELADAAQRLLADVDALARAYAWSEAEILAMSAPRRAAYLAMTGP